MTPSLAVAKAKFLKLNLIWPLILLGAIIILLVMYVVETNNQASQSFTIRKLEIQKQELNEEIRQLSWDIGSHRSLDAIKSRAQALSLAAPSDVSFVKGSLETVAVAK